VVLAVLVVAAMEAIQMVLLELQILVVALAVTATQEHLLEMQEALAS
jgi:hypothetical protein